MYKLIKIENGLYNVTENDKVIAIVQRDKRGGYKRTIYHALSGQWIQPAAFNHFATLKDVKKRYDIT